MKSLSSLMNLEGRVALVTGGSGHIGQVACESLAELGAAIVVLDMNRGSCIDTAESIRSTYGVDTHALTMDLTDEDAVRSVPESLQSKFGRLDILIHCAALVGTSELEGWAVPFQDQNINTWKQALDVNLTAPFLLTHVCAELLTLSGHGSVINMSSIYALVGPDLDLYEGTDLGNPAAYSASKGGLIQLTRWLSTVMAPYVRVNAISAGGVSRGQSKLFHDRYVARTPLNRMATEEDLKGGVAYLSSDLSAYVTGHNLVIDGGWVTW